MPTLHHFPPSRRLSVAEARAGAHAAKPATAITEAERVRRTYSAKYERTTRPGDVGAVVAMSSGVRIHARRTETDPADMGTTLGIDAVKTAQAAGSMKHFRISATTVVCVLLASPFLGALGWAISARLFS